MKEIFKQWINEAKQSRNTLEADVNEILTGWYLLGRKWAGYADAADLKKQLEKRKKEIGEEKYKVQEKRAEAMAKEFLKWAKSEGIKGKVKKAWWTARPGVLSKAVGQPVDSRDNPTDILVQFSDGTFIGISAKSTKQTKGEIGFKNPGLGQVAKFLNSDIVDWVKKEEQKIIDKLNLPKSVKERKKFIRANSDIAEKTRAIGMKILKAVRDHLIEKLTNEYKKDKENVLQYLLQNWMGSDKDLFPRYVKVTGRSGEGNKPALATLVDPLKNEKLKTILEHPIEFVPVGDQGIGVLSKGKKIMKARPKYTSEKLASSIKLSVEGW